MTALTWITAILLLLGIGGTGVMKLTSKPMAVEAANRLGYENIRMPLGVIEVLAPIGLIIGAISSDFEWLGVVAAVGIIVLMSGAVLYHLRAKDKAEMIPAAVLILAAVLYIVALANT